MPQKIPSEIQKTKDSDAGDRIQTTINIANGMNRKPNNLRRTLDKSHTKKWRNTILRIVTWIMIFIAIIMLSFMVIKDRLLYIGQWNQAKHDLLETIGLKPSAPIPLTYIPIANTAFLIPKEKWLKNDAISNFNEKVINIQLEISPEISPLPPRKDNNGDDIFVSKDKIVIVINSYGNSNQIKEFPRVPHSIIDTSNPLMEEISDQKNQGLRRFRRLLGGYEYTQEEARQASKTSGKELILNQNGKYYYIHKTEVDYILVKENRVKYFISCIDVNDITKETCHIYFPWGDFIMIKIYFIKELLPRGIAMADKVTDKLREFEINGKAIQKSSPEIQKSITIWDKSEDTVFLQWINNL